MESNFYNMMNGYNIFQRVEMRNLSTIIRIGLIIICFWGKSEASIELNSGEHNIILVLYHIILLLLYFIYTF